MNAAPEQIDMGDGYWELTDRYGALWVFETARYTVALFAEPEDSFSEEDAAFARDYDPAHWFCATVAVYGPGGKRIGLDTLGGCSYHSFGDFYASHRDPDPAKRNTLALKAKNITICHYFPSLVRQAIADARCTLGGR